MEHDELLKEFALVYGVWGNYTDCLLVGVGYVEARTIDEAMVLAMKDFTEHRQWNDFEMTRVELFDGGTNDEVDDDGSIIHCWNAYYEVKGKNGSYDGVGMPYAKTKEEAM